VIVGQVTFTPQLLEDSLYPLSQTLEHPASFDAALGAALAKKTGQKYDSRALKSR